MGTDTLGFVIVGLLTLTGTYVTARAARNTNTVTVDVRIFQALQEDVVRLQARVDDLREAVRKAEDETDDERRRRRHIELQVESLADLVGRMTRKMHAAGLDPPQAAQTYLGFPATRTRGYHDTPGKNKPD